MSLKDEFYKRIRKLVVSIAKKLPSQINPNTLTLLGLLFALLAGLSFAFGEIVCAIVFMLVSGFLDLLDGAVAEANDKKTEFGGVLDSVSDRYADVLIITGIMLGYSLNISTFWFLVGISAVVGSILVSYVRAKGERVLNERITVGIADRPARIVLIIAGAIFECMNFAILTVAILSHFTVWQRMQLIKKKLEEKKNK